MQKTVTKRGKKGGSYADYVTEFDSFAEYLDIAAKEPDEKRGGSSRRVESDKWSGTRNFAEAMTLAREGWPEGVEMMGDIAAHLSAVTGGLCVKPEILWDITGDFADAGLFASGVPECMGSFAEVIAESRGKVVSILMNCSASGGVDKKVMMKRGAAVLALVDCLEQSGRSCEIFVGEGVTSGYSHGSSYMFYVPVKRAGEIAELDRLAFVLAHPAMLRRLAFSVEEQEDDAIREEFEFHRSGNYGYPAEIKNKDERFNLIVPELSLVNWHNDKDALAWVKRSLVEQGCEVEGMEKAAPAEQID